MAATLLVLALLGMLAGSDACIQVYGTVQEGHVSHSRYNLQLAAWLL